MKKNSYNHLSKKERYEIKEMLDKSMGITEIAGILDRSKGAISMEVNRNKEDGKYMPCVAHEKYEERLHKEDELKIEKSPFLQAYIAKGMTIHAWAPDVMAGRLKLDKSAETVSTESIYRYIYTSPIAIKAGLYRYLPQKKFKRQERGKRVKRVIIPNRASIHERPAIANQKKELGHVEIDLTFHKGNQSKNIGVMVDKVTQKVFLMLNRSKTSLTVTTGFMKKIRLIPENLRKTLTMDNGKEFVGHMAYKLLGFETYFCDAYRPRQKALVEKMNSMIHRILPKNIDINTITQEVLDNVENILNSMPRRIFGYKTPNEMWEENL